MGASKRLPVHSYNQPSRVPARLVNCYAQQTVGKDAVELRGAPGIRPFTALGGGGRGLYVMRNQLYCAAGEGFYRIDDQGSETLLGALPGSGKLTFAGNGVEIVCSNKYIYAQGTVQLITDPDLPAISCVDSIDRYVVWAESGSQKWGSSLLIDGANYDGEYWALKDVYHDDLVCLKASHRQVVLFGAEASEIWYNEGGSPFPFARLAGGDMDIGCAARLGVCLQDNSIFWIANDLTARRLAGQIPQRVSTHGFEEAVANYLRVDDCQAFSLTWEGHLFVVFRFPTATATTGACWVLDVTTNEWHERATYGSTTWDVIDAAECYGKTFVQRASDGSVGYLDDKCYTEFEGTLRKEWTYDQVYDSNRPLVHSELELVARTGDAPIGSVGHINLELSDDGGNTWLMLPRRELGRTGQYKHVIRWNRLGQARDRVYRMSMFDAAVPLHVMDTTLRMEIA